MRKMPCLFVREFVNNRVANITDQVTPGCEWVLAGEGLPFVKRDGTSCAVINGVLHRRCDAKRGKTPPPDAIPCDPTPDPATGHWPHWMPCWIGDPASKWHMRAWEETSPAPLADGTYELCGPHFQANPEHLPYDTFIGHTSERALGGWVNGATTYDILRACLETWPHEGIVFHHPDGRMAKIRRADFGYAWPIPEVAT